MFALKESPMKMLYGNTNNAVTIPDNIPIPQNLNNALNALSCPEPILPHKRTFISALNSGPFYGNGHLILGNSFNRSADKTTDVWNERIFKRLPGTYLVDIQRIWEGYDGRWVNEAPLLLRFETIDVVLAPHHDNENINVWTGYLDTNAPVYEARNNSAENKQANENSCLHWLAYRRIKGLVGKQVQSIHMFSITKTTEKSPCEKIHSQRRLFNLSLNDGHTYTFINKQGTITLCI